MARVGANHSHDATAADHLAVFADAFDACSYLHDGLACRLLVGLVRFGVRCGSCGAGRSAFARFDPGHDAGLGRVEG